MADVIARLTTIGWENGARKAGMYGTQMQSTGQKLRIASYGFFMLGGAIAGIGAAFTLAAIKSVGAARDFEKAMVRLKAISGATGVELAGLTEDVQMFAQKYGVSSVMIAEGMTTIAQAGHGVADLGPITDASLKLAIATGEDMNAMSLSMVTTMHQFGMKAEEVNKVLNIMAYTELSTTLSMKGFGQAMLYAGSMARFVNMDLDTTALILGQVNNSLGNAGVTGRSFAMSVRNLVHPTQEAERWMRRLGIAVIYTDQGQMDYIATMKSVKDGIDSINYGTAAWNELEKEKIITMMFGARSARFVAIMLRNYDEIVLGVSEGVKALTEDEEKWTYINNIVNMQLTTMYTQQGVLKESVNKLGRALAMSLLPALTKVVSLFSSLINFAAEWIGSHPAIAAGLFVMIGGFGLLATAVGSSLLLFGLLAATIGFLAPLGLAPILAGVTAFGFGLAGLAITAGMLTLSFYLLWKVMKNWEEMSFTEKILNIVIALATAAAGALALAWAIKSLGGAARALAGINLFGKTGKAATAGTSMEAVAGARAVGKPRTLFGYGKDAQGRWRNKGKFARSPFGKITDLFGKLGGGGKRGGTFAGGIGKLGSLGKMPEIIKKITGSGLFKWLGKIANKFIVFTLAYDAAKSLYDQIKLLYEEGISFDTLATAAKDFTRDIAKSLYDLAIGIITLPLDIGAWIAEKLGAVNLSDKLSGWTDFLSTDLWNQGLKGFRYFIRDLKSLITNATASLKTALKNMWNFEMGWNSKSISYPTLDGWKKFTVPGYRFNLSSFHTGTNQVPKDMMAYLRKGEKVITPAQQSSEGGGTTVQFMQGATLNIAKEIDSQRFLRDMEIMLQHSLAISRKRRSM